MKGNTELQQQQQQQREKYYGFVNNNNVSNNNESSSFNEKLNKGRAGLLLVNSKNNSSLDENNLKNVAASTHNSFEILNNNYYYSTIRLENNNNILNSIDSCTSTNAVFLKHGVSVNNCETKENMLVQTFIDGLLGNKKSSEINLPVTTRSKNLQQQQQQQSEMSSIASEKMSNLNEANNFSQPLSDAYYENESHKNSGKIKFSFNSHINCYCHSGGHQINESR